MKKIFFHLAFIFHLSSFIFACAPVAPSAPQLVNVSASLAAQPWLEELFACADEASVTLNVTSDSPDLSLRLALPDGWAGSVFQVGTEDLLIVASLASSLGPLTLDQARTIFAGQGNSSVQVWGYASEEETQKMFEQAVMNGRGVTSFARLAVSPSHMIESLSADVNAVGLLPRRWMTDGLRELLVSASVPVLALTPSEPAGPVRDLIACLQK